MPPTPQPFQSISKAGYLWRWTEFTLLFLLLPALLAAAVDKSARFHPAMTASGLRVLVELGATPGRLIFPVLLGTTVLIIALLLLDRSFDNSQLWGWRRAKKDLPRIITLWAWLAVGLVGVTAYIAFGTDMLPENAFFRLPRENPRILLIIWLFYPWVSAFPQEITHRVFFWHRYAVLFPDRVLMILVNALVFAWMHALFWNWVALAMTFAGGLLFAWTYDRTRSALAAGIEHGLYGAWCFTIGLGWFVFAGR